MEMVSKISSWKKTGVICITSFTIGIIFEKNFRLYTNTGSDLLMKNQLISDQQGDVLDSSMFEKQLPPPRNLVAKISEYGFPSMDSLRSYANFVLSYDRRNRVANWVLEYVTPEDITSNEYDRQGIEFREDTSFHRYFRSTNKDYKSSGYDRGHLAAAGNYRSNKEYIRETYVLSNSAPQIGQGFNRDKWNELEKYCRKKIREYKGAWICTGPLYLPRKDHKSGKQFVKYEVIGHNHVAVPTHFFKVLLYKINEQYFMECFLMPNQPINEKTMIQSFRVNPEVIERAAGILLFNHLPRKQLKINP